MANAIPAGIEVVKDVGAAPGLLDLFLWLAYWCHVAKAEERFPLFGAFGFPA
ncbi:MAG: hypothetical protein IT168_08570 [Bryobacterales bacterium]|nr:hypothetical protein [Bryobacterales bacterium]